MKKQIILILILFFNNYSYSSPFLDRCRTTIKALNVAVGVAQLYRKIRHIEPVEGNQSHSLKNLFNKALPISSDAEEGANGVSSSVRVQIEMALSAGKIGRKKGVKTLKRMLDQKLPHEVLVVIIQVAGEWGGSEGAEIMDEIFKQDVFSMDDVERNVQ